MDTSALHDLVASKHQGVLVTLKRDGRPQLSNVAYVLGDDDVIRVSVTDDRAKTANLRRDPRASLHVARDDFYAYAVVESTARLLPVARSPTIRPSTPSSRTTATSWASTTTGTTTGGRWWPTAD